jgi:hypothetical protein
MFKREDDDRIGQRDIAERAYQSLWHFLIAGVGVYELRNHKTKLSKVLACGLIAFHLDGAIADLTDTRPLSRRVLNYIVGVDNDNEPTRALPNSERGLPQRPRRKVRE